VPVPCIMAHTCTQQDGWPDAPKDGQCHASPASAHSNVSYGSSLCPTGTSRGDAPQHCISHGGPSSVALIWKQPVHGRCTCIMVCSFDGKHELCQCHDFPACAELIEEVVTKRGLCRAYGVFVGQQTRAGKTPCSTSNVMALLKCKVNLGSGQNSVAVPCMWCVTLTARTNR
jgi:hypothetical protein